MAKTNKTGRNERHEHFTAMVRSMMEAPAWRALSPSAQSLYPWLRLEWRGANANNNGQLRLSVRQASQRMGCSIHTAARAFHDLQAKGFAVVTESGCLGTEGEGKSTAYELTELALPGVVNGRRLYLNWSKGRDFSVVKATTGNPEGRNGKTKTLVQNDDRPVIKMSTFRKTPSPK